MKNISLSSRDLEHLNRYNLDQGVCHSESIIYEMNLNQNYLLKISKDFLRNGLELDKDKKKSVEYLNHLPKTFDCFAIPEYFVYVDNVLAGVATKKIENAKNLGFILNGRKSSLKDKLKYLKMIGSVLYNIQNENLGFSIGDLHSYNFLVDQDDKLHVVDLDSVYLENNKPLKTFYFSNFKVLKNTSVFSSKYHVENGKLYPNLNSDLLCYNYMLINAIASKNMHFLEVSEYLKYISYLEEIGYGENIISIFKNIYSNRDNVNPVLYFDEVRDDLEFQSMYSSYVKRK